MSPDTPFCDLSQSGRDFCQNGFCCNETRLNIYRRGCWINGDTFKSFKPFFRLTGKFNLGITKIQPLNDGCDNAKGLARHFSIATFHSVEEHLPLNQGLANLINRLRHIVCEHLLCKPGGVFHRMFRPCCVDLHFTLSDCELNFRHSAPFAIR